MAGILVTDRGGATMKAAGSVSGYILPVILKGPAETKDIFNNIPNISFRDDDVMLASYPKTGTNWVYEMAMMISNKTAARIKSNKLETMLETQSEQELAAIPSPRILDSHLNLRYFPKDMKKKQIRTILVVRNPKDTAVSFYNHMTGIRFYEYSGKWDDWLPLFIGGELEYGHYADYLNEWGEAIRKGPDFPLHVVHYEDLHEHGIREIKRLSQFLDADVSDEFLQEIYEACSFRKMAENKFSPETKKLILTKDFQFFRKGVIGDWKNWFSQEQSDNFDKVWETKMKEPVFKFTYEPSKTAP